jgi:Lrp/AsnC family leucine-responsive transcriptional regulator
MSGDADYFLELAAADTADYERIYRTYLSQFPGVARIRSSFALRTVCKTTALQLP